MVEAWRRPRAIPLETCGSWKSWYPPRCGTSSPAPAWPRPWPLIRLGSQTSSFTRVIWTSSRAPLLRRATNRPHEMLSVTSASHLKESFAARPWAYAFPLFALAGLTGMKIMNTAGRAIDAFLSSCAFILGMLTSVAAGLYPYVLPSSTDPALSLTIHNTAAARYGLEVGLIWFIPGMLLTSAYFIYTYRSFAGKV